MLHLSFISQKFGHLGSNGAAEDKSMSGLQKVNMGYKILSHDELYHRPRLLLRRARLICTPDRCRREIEH
jgi:hypothetical protein